MRPRLHFNADRVYSFRVTLSKNVMPLTLLRRGIWKRLVLRNGECPQSPSVQTLKRHRSQHGHRSSANDCEKKEENASRSGAHLHRLQVTEAAAQSVYGIRLAPVQSAYRILEVAPVFHKLRRYALPWILWVS